MDFITFIIVAHKNRTSFRNWIR